MSDVGPSETSVEEAGRIDTAESLPVAEEEVEAPVPSATPRGGASRGLGGLLAMLRESNTTIEPEEEANILDIAAPVESTSCEMKETSVPVDQATLTEVLITMDVVVKLSTDKEVPPSTTPSDIWVERKERKVASGVAALLQQLRGSSDVNVVDAVESNDPEVDESTAKENVGDTVDLSTMNRKERRAFLHKQREALGIPRTEENLPEPEPPAKIARYEVPFRLWDVSPECSFVESKVFADSSFSFGFGESVLPNNYVKLAKFSPCGQFLASTSQDRRARIFRFDETHHTISLMSSIPLGDLPYDAVWHPSGEMLATSAKHHPIHVWNTEGQREGSYRGINHLDELASAQTMAFSRDGLTMYAGYDKCIRIWDVRRPGKQTREIKTWRTKPHNDGQKGIVSAIAIHPVHAGVYAVGTYGTSIGLYSDRTNFVECMFGGDFSAITDLKYSSDGIRLFSCGRKTNSIECWDMRFTSKAIFTLQRPFETNQRVYFDIDSSDRFLFTGTSTGQIVVFDLQNGDVVRMPRHTLDAIGCAIPCVSLHPRYPVVAACSGERVFPSPVINIADEPEDPVAVESNYHDIATTEKLLNCIQIWKY